MDHSSGTAGYKLLAVAWLIGAGLPFVLGASLVTIILWLSLLTAVGLMVVILARVAAPPRPGQSDLLKDH